VNSGHQTGPRRLLDAIHGASVGYGYRPERVLWILAALLLLVTVSLEIPPDQATLRATTAAGIVYTTHGPIPTAVVPAVSAPLAPDPVNTSPATRQQLDLQPRSTAPMMLHTDSCGDGQVRCFNSVLYAIDTVIPLISLDQRSTWYPDPHTMNGSFMQWWLNIATLLGWLLSSVFVLSLARLSRTT
jgi:hypothetical protein